ncbi:MAG: hypothetical protein ACSHX8_11450 [Opitutaceae bacterium]
MKISILAITVITATSAVSAENILWDFGGRTNTESDISDFVAAGVTEDLTGSTVTNIKGATEMSDGTVSVSFSETISCAHYPKVYDAEGSSLMNDYAYLIGPDDYSPVNASFSISGLSSVLEPNKEYGFYIWGKGDKVHQYSTLTFEGDTQTVNATLDARYHSADNFYVKFKFSTDEVIVDRLSIDWKKAQTDDQYAAINGLAIVYIPEANISTLLVGALSLSLAMVRRRRS